MASIQAIIPPTYVPAREVIVSEGSGDSDQSAHGKRLDALLFDRARDIVMTEKISDAGDYDTRLKYVFSCLQNVQKSIYGKAGMGLTEEVALAKLSVTLTPEATSPRDQDVIRKSQEDEWEVETQASPEEPAKHFVIAEDTMEKLSKKDYQRIRAMNLENKHSGDYIKDLESRLSYVETVLQSVQKSANRARDSQGESIPSPDNEDVAYGIVVSKL